jgi:mitogen-activated protein kinase kinase kinase 5
MKKCSLISRQTKSKASTRLKSSISAPIGEGLSRSISMSPEHHNNHNTNSSLANNPPSPATTSGHINVATTHANNTKLTLNTKEANEAKDNVNLSDGVEYNLTPTELMDPIFESTRRTSSGSIRSTDVIDSIGSPTMGLMEPDFSETSDRFYLLKKDSQRRAFVVRVLKVDKVLIIDSWHRLIAKPDSLTKENLIVLMEGIRDYLPEQNVTPLDKAITQVQSEHSSDATNFADILSLALYKFQDAVNSIIRRHKIKPHWMFAMDSIIRNAVLQSVNFLHPENAQPPPPLDAAVHLEPYPFEDQSATPKIMASSPVNSTPPPQAQSLQKSLAVVQNFIKHLAFELEGQTSSGSSAAGSHSQPSSAKKVDGKLRQWLKELEIDEASIRKFADEELSLHDVIHLMTRDDLGRLNLKLGPELRIWDKIVKERKKT